MENIFDKMFGHLKKNTKVLIWVAICCVVGIVLGIVILFGEKSYLNLLTSKNQNMLGYITGSASIFKLFWKRLFNGILALSTIFIFCLNYYSSFLCFVYFAYQTAVCTLVCGTLIAYQGFSAVFNVILLIVPSNLVLLAVLAIGFSVFYERAKCQQQYKQTFAKSFKYNPNFLILLIMVLLALVALNIIVSIIVPFIIKGIYVVYY